MNNQTNTVQMAVVHPGAKASDGEFTFEMQARYKDGRTVKYALIPSDAEKLYKELGAYLQATTKSNEGS